jgi:hypothetical protein
VTEQLEPRPQPGDDEAPSQASGGRDVARPGGGRTEGETAVDDALGQGGPPED